MKNMYNRNRKTAFSLIEISIVILISSILMTGAVSISVNAVKNAKIKTTKARINDIYAALGQYLIVNKKLPCPAEIKLSKTDNANYGLASSGDGSCNNGGNTSSYSNNTGNIKAYGMVPVQTLGIPLDMAEDAFGNKFAYIVDKNMTRAAGSGNSFEGTEGNMTVVEKSAATEVNSISNAAFFIISYGANQNGAIAADSNLQMTASSDADEISNSLVVTNEGSNPPLANFGAKIIYSSGNSETFDDIVFYKTRPQLAMDFNIMDYLTCPTQTFTNVYGANSMAWPVGYYNQIIVASTTCPSGYTNGPVRPTRRCGVNGTWGEIINPCQQ